MTGCASTPKPQVTEEPVVYATPAERAFQLGVDHRIVQSCRAELGDRRVAAHTQSAELLLSSYPKNLRSTVNRAYVQGAATAAEPFHKIPCEAVAAMISEQLACNDAETRKNLKAAAHLK